MKSITDSQRGISLYLAIMTMSIILSITLGLAAVMVNQLRMVRGWENSVAAFYVADTGIERATQGIYSYFKNDFPGNFVGTKTFNDIGLWPNGPKFSSEIKCCASNSAGCTFCTAGSSPGCTVTKLCPLGIPYEDSSCLGSYFCVKSVGTYNEVKRAIKTTL
jgi:hypothetical protein